MKNIFTLCLLGVVTSANHLIFNHKLDEHWLTFKRVFEKNYDSSEEVTRRMLYEEKITDIVRHNLQADMGLYSYYKGVNKFSDMTAEEVSEHLSKCAARLTDYENGSTFLVPYNVQIPNSIDWTKKGLVTPVKDQKECGSCWAFSATGALEGQHKRKTGKLVRLSEQNLIDCSRIAGNHGCKGGFMELAFNYVKWNDGIATEKSYPYTGKDIKKCRFKEKSIGAICSGYVVIPKGDEEDLKKAVATVGPISAAIDVPSSLMEYKKGIYDEPRCNSSNLQHAVLVVGYGTEGGKDYWLVKNSWGKSWGSKGYLKLRRNHKNLCGIASEALFPLV